MKLKLLIIALLFGITVKAQNTLNVTPSHLEAADELLKSSGADSLFKSSMQLSLKQSSANIPADKREKFMAVMNSFFAKYISWDLLKDQLAAMYATEFTEPELKQISAFYRTPLGRKLNAKQPILMQKAMQLGQQMVQSHKIELQQMMQDAFKEQQ